MRCPACGQDNTDDMRFCTGCGTPLPSAAWAPPPPRAALAAAAYAAAPEAQAVPPYMSAPPGVGVYPQSASAVPAPPQSGTLPVGSVPGAYPTPYPPYHYAPAPQIINNITVTAMAPPTPAVVVVAGQAGGPNLLIRALWFLFIGLWLGPLWLVVAWLLLLSIIGLPLGLLMINRLPQVMTLKPLGSWTTVTVQKTVVVVSQSRPPQRPFLARALYFLLVGSWFSLVWLALTYTLIVATLGLALPLAFWMCDLVPAVTTLARQ